MSIEVIFMPKPERWGKKFKDSRDWVEYNSTLIKRGERYYIIYEGNGG